VNAATASLLGVIAGGVIGLAGTLVAARHAAKQAREERVERRKEDRRGEVLAAVREFLTEAQSQEHVVALRRWGNSDEDSRTTDALWLRQKILAVSSPSLGTVCDKYAKVLHDLTWQPLGEVAKLSEDQLWNKKIGPKREPFLRAASVALGGESPSWDPSTKAASTGTSDAVRD
jgi:gas vesicle protein